MVVLIDALMMSTNEMQWRQIRSESGRKETRSSLTHFRKRFASPITLIAARSWALRDPEHPESVRRRRASMGVVLVPLFGMNTILSVIKGRISHSKWLRVPLAARAKD